MIAQQFKFVLLSARIAIFFAKVDNNYDDHEKDFIKNYINDLQQDLSVEEEKALYELEKENLTITDIINATENFLQLYPERNRRPLLHTFMHLIDMVILVDNIIDPAEEEAFDKWKDYFDVK